MQKRILLIVVFVLFMVACDAEGAYEDYERPFVPEAAGSLSIGAIGDDMPISRALVTRMIALTFADPAAINQAQRIITFSDTSPDEWFDRYINKLHILGHTGGFDERFYPNEPLTLSQAQALLDSIYPDNSIRIQLNDENRHLAISYALWVNLYMQLLAEINATQIREQNAVVLITPAFNGDLPEGNVISSLGHFAAAGLDFSDFLNKELSLLTRGNEVLAIIGITSLEPTLQNVFVVEQNAETITIFAGGAGRTYYLADGINADIGRIADITISGNKALSLETFDEVQTGVVKEIGSNFIEIEDIGRIALQDNFSIFSQIGDSVSLGRISQITIGYDVADFVLRDGEIAAAIILRRPVPEHIRVVISTTGFTSRIHNTVKLRSAGGLQVFTPDGLIEFAPNEVFNLNAQNTYILGTERVTVMPAGAYPIEIMSISRNWPSGASPQYRGFLEIMGRQGGFVIVNQLLLEEYLFAVIPSEMPTSFGLEAAKVQAVTARSYAYNQFFANRFHAYGANIDDSVMTQVYNNIPETALAIQAVSETAGLFLVFGNEVVSANYFSTSSGHSADRGDVWLNSQTGRLDAETPPYLRGVAQMAGADFGDLSNEEKACNFFMDTSIVAYDDHSPWFRWNFELTAAQLTQIVDSNLPRLVAARPHNFYPLGITGIGEVVRLEVANRGRGGNINELIVHGTSATISVLTEFTIRELLTPTLPEGITLNRHNATPVTNHFILPSTFMTFTQTAAGNVQFHGGGFGHGVGMSQHGAFGMVERGYDFRQILAHFYPGTAVSPRN